MRNFNIADEGKNQEALFEWAKWQSKLHPELGLMYHVPNEGKRTQTAGARLKRQGLKSGVPDLVLPVARAGYHGLYIELKAGKGKPTKAQMEWIEGLRQQGYKAECITGWRAAAQEILDYLGGDKECRK